MASLLGCAKAGMEKGWMDALVSGWMDEWMDETTIRYPYQRGEG